jgi:membrane fusion protein, multidrug efflux system
MNMIDKIRADEVVTEAKSRPRWQRGALVLLPLALVAGGVGLASREPPPVAAPPPPTVTVATPLVRQITEWDEYIGRFEASRVVEVRPRVSGAITAVLFRDGEFVRQGQLLFTIDPRPFAAALSEARAGVETASSELALAQADLGRATRLLEVDAVSRSDVDQLRSRVRSAQAALSAAHARVRSRALDVEFTQVRAPISGRVSDRKVDAGNLVSAGEGTASTALTTINALDPIYFSFEGSEALFLKMKRAGQGGAAPSPVEIRLQDEPDYRWRGRLDFTDNGLDPRSGTIRGRAVIRNAGAFLTPGMFGNMRLSAGGTRAALLVPDAAIQTDQTRKLVPVLAADGTITPKPVQLGPVVDGLRVVRSGLTTADRIVIEGAQLAMPGTKVGVRQGRIAPVAAPPQAPVAAPISGEVTLAR